MSFAFAGSRNSPISAPAMNPLRLPERITRPFGRFALDGGEDVIKFGNHISPTMYWRRHPAYR